MGRFGASKWVKIKVFDYFVKTFPMDSHQSCFICPLALLSEMCTIWALKAQFWAILDPKVRRNFWVWSLSQKVVTGFTSVLLHMLIGSTSSSAECGIWASDAQFCGHFAPANKSKFRLLVFFIKKFSLVSHQYCFTCRLQVCLDVWRIWASDAQFVGHFGPQD